MLELHRKINLGIDIDSDNLSRDLNNIPGFSYCCEMLLQK